MTTSTSAVRSNVDVARVIGQAFGLLGRNLPAFLILGVILVGVPAVAMGVWRVILPLRAGFTVGNVLVYIAHVAAGALLQAAAVHKVTADLHGRRATVLDSLGVALRHAAPLVAIGVIAVVAFFAGLLLLIVPGFIVCAAWYVVVAAYVVDRPGLLGAFRRSAELTRGNRWRIAALVAISLVGQLLLGRVLALAFVVPALLGFAAPVFIYSAAITPLFYVAVTLMNAALATALYLELRRLREGVDLTGANVFD